MKKIDINSDLGESFGAWKMGDDLAMLEIVSSCNIACGFHAGDPAGIFDVLQKAKEFNVSVGAHISYRDLVGFGRRNIEISSRDLIADVIYQIGALQGLAISAGTKIKYVKPHGALYNKIAFDKKQAKDVIKAILLIDPTLKLMVLANSPIINWAKDSGLEVISEAFADRNYTNQGQLVSRQEKEAVLHDSQIIANRILNFIQTGKIKTIDNQIISLEAESICVHGDTLGAVQMAKAIKDILIANNVEISSFVKNNFKNVKY